MNEQELSKHLDEFLEDKDISEEKKKQIRRKCTGQSCPYTKDELIEIANKEIQIDDGRTLLND